MVSAPSSRIESRSPEPAGEPVRIGVGLPQDRLSAWELQRAAFSLPETAGSEVPGRRDELRVVARGGRVVSCLTLVHTTLWVRGREVPMGGIRHVATHPDHQNQGYASSLLRDTLRDLRGQGTVASVLFPFSFRYYRKFGYELGGNHCHFWCRRTAIPGYVDGGACRPAEPRDWPALTGVDCSRHALRRCSLVREADRWASVGADPSRWILVHPGRNGGVDGYLVGEDARDSYGGKVARILDLTATNPVAWRGLIGSLAAVDAESVEWNASATDLTASGLMRPVAPLREGYKPRGIVTVRPMFQLRVVDVEAALRACCPGCPPGSYRLGFRIRDDVLPENERRLTLHCNGVGAELRPSRSGDPYLELDIRIFSQVFSGYMSPEEAAAQGLARASSPAALETAERLFAAGDPFISDLDRF